MKQVIVIRKDLKMRRGKEIAQGSHASISFLTRRLQNSLKVLDTYQIKLKPAEIAWIEGRFRKICVIVNSEEELFEIHKRAQDSGLESHLIKDGGATEFHGVPTYTCLAIGPDDPEKIDKITGHLKLY
jgi:PTH2 family peptidyl-tRNA hydrolase